MKRYIFFAVAMLFCNGLQASQHLRTANPKKLAGIFKSDDKKLLGIKWGNWGSRPYEYCWAGEVVSIANKRVIDLGVGLPSQYTWYAHAVKNLKPAYYVGVDHDERMEKEVISELNYDMLHMNMTELLFQDKNFDVAYCISTFEHIPYDIFIKTIQEAHRVLKDDGVLVITLDEQWNKDVPVQHSSSWNDLEQSVTRNGMFFQRNISFGLPDFLDLIKDYFVLVDDDMAVDKDRKIIFSQKTGHLYYQRTNKDLRILRSPESINSCVSYAVLKKR